jgi:hypothetical protein
MPTHAARSDLETLRQVVTMYDEHGQNTHSQDPTEKLLVIANMIALLEKDPNGTSVRLDAGIRRIVTNAREHIEVIAKMLEPEFEARIGLEIAKRMQNAQSEIQKVIQEYCDTHAEESPQLFRAQWELEQIEKLHLRFVKQCGTFGSHE